jgi:DNA polymerase-3 subunit epsilon
VVAAAWADGKVTDVKARDLLLVAELLGIAPERARHCIEHRPASGRAPISRVDLRGKLICFTGSLEHHTFNGEPVTRPVAESLAAEAGLIVRPGVTKKLDILVVADSNSLSGKAKKARDYGTRIMTATAFFAAIGKGIDS